MYTADPTVGTSSALWDPLATGLGYPLEQAEDDLRSLTYTSEPLAEDIEVTGTPEAVLHVALEEGDELQLVAKLNVVSPEGRSTMICTGWLNAAHRETVERGQPVERNVVQEYRIRMWAGSYLVPTGHRLRLAIGEPVWKIERDLGSGDVAVTLGAMDELRLPSGGSFRIEHSARATAVPNRPDGAALHSEARVDVRLPAGEQVVVRTRSRFTRDTTLMNGEVMLDGRRVFTGEWQER